MVQQYVVHIIPGCVGLVNSYITNCKLTMKLLKPLVIISLVYFLVNFLQTKYHGKILYDFLDWKDINSLYVIITMESVFSCVYLLMCYIDAHFKNDTLGGKKIKNN